MAKRAGILICTHRVVFGHLLLDALQRGARYRRVQLVHDAREAVRVAGRGAVDVVLLEPGNPGFDVFRDAARIQRRHPGVRVVFIADSSPIGWVARAVRMRASGYLGKCATLDDIRRAIDTALSGQRFFTPCASRVVGDLAADAGDVPDLTDRESVVLRGICDGRSSKEIARSLGLEVKTVDSIRARIMEKTGTARATSLVRYACSERLVDIASRFEPRHTAGFHRH
ncbi:MAG: response regulator transcription factor [Planctomycetes bacterium]|nr:response regulator transcription factor [Planctomycetota bacterium]